MNIYDCVIENNNDPEKLGRVQVRIVGKHTENRSDSEDNNYLPVTDLPWAIFFYNNGFSVPEQGDVGKCVFTDKDEQNVILLGITKKKIESLPSFNDGFSDPDENNPTSDQVGESQVSRLARNENISNTIIQDKKDNRKTGVVTNTTSFDEPETEFDPEYPDNKVIHTKSGHVIEVDDTTGKERIHIHHKSGSFIEFFPNGDEVTNIKGNKYTIAIGDENILVEGDKNIRIEGNENVEISGAKNIKVIGNSVLEVGGNVEISATGSVTISGSAISLN